MVLEHLAGLHTGAQLVKDALSMHRELKATKEGMLKKTEELEQKLEQAEQQLKLAEAAAAQELGYRLAGAPSRRRS